MSSVSAEPGEWERNMEAPEHPADEVKQLRRCVNDLISVIALPAIWSGGGTSQMVRTLADVLMDMLDLDLDRGVLDPKIRGRVAPATRSFARSPTRHLSGLANPALWFVDGQCRDLRCPQHHRPATTQHCT